MKVSTYNKYKAMITTLREVYTEFPLQMLLVFLEVAQDDKGLTVSQVQKRTGLSQSSASRHCRGLTKLMTASRPGHDLAEWVPDPLDFRSKLLRLNAKGRVVAAKLEEILS